jgi:hypothetical protein
MEQETGQREALDESAGEGEEFVTAKVHKGDGRGSPSRLFSQEDQYSILRDEEEEMEERQGCVRGSRASLACERGDGGGVARAFAILDDPCGKCRCVCLLRAGA